MMSDRRSEKGKCVKFQQVLHSFSIGPYLTAISSLPWGSAAGGGPQMVRLGRGVCPHDGGSI